MQIFQSTLSQMAFLFTLIIIGYLLVKCRVLDAGAAGVLSKLESWLFVPALVMGTFMGKFTVDILQKAGTLVLFSFGVMAVIIPLAFLLSRLCTKDAYKRRIYAYGLMFSNFGFMGNALVEALYPDVFFEYLLFAIPLWILIYIWAVPMLLIADAGGEQSMRSRLKSFINPMFIFMIIGMILGLTGLKLPAWTVSLIDTCGDCMSPIAMLLTGMTIAKMDIRRVLSDKSIYVITAIRLILIPAAAIGVLLLLPIDRTMFICAVCALAMPLGLNTLVIPAAYGKDTSAAAGMALVSHLASCITIPVVFMAMDLIMRV